MAKKNKLPRQLTEKERIEQADQIYEVFPSILQKMEWHQLEELIYFKPYSQEEYHRQLKSLDIATTFKELNFIAQLSNVINAINNYYYSNKIDISEEDYHEWLNGLPEPLRSDHQAAGLIECKKLMPLRRYVLEKRDIGQIEFMQEVLTTNDFQFWQAFDFWLNNKELVEKFMEQRDKAD